MSAQKPLVIFVRRFTKREKDDLRLIEIGDEAYGLFDEAGNTYGMGGGFSAAQSISSEFASRGCLVVWYAP